MNVEFKLIARYNRNHRGECPRKNYLAFAKWHAEMTQCICEPRHCLSRMTLYGRAKPGRH